MQSNRQLPRWIWFILTIRHPPTCSAVHARVAARWGRVISAFVGSTAPQALSSIPEERGLITVTNTVISKQLASHWHLQTATTSSVSISCIYDGFIQFHSIQIICKSEWTWAGISHLLGGVPRRESSNFSMTYHLLTLFLASRRVLLPGQKGVSLSFWLMLIPYFVSKKHHLPGHQKSGTTCLLEPKLTGTVASCNFPARHILDQRKIHKVWKSG